MGLWDGSLAVGIPEVDRLHEAVLSRMDEVLEAIGEEDTGRTETLLRELAGEVARHFETEEALAPPYALTREHVEGHRLFLAELERLRDAFARRGLAPALPLWIRSRVVNWFKFHIGTQDLAMAEAIASGRGAGAPTAPAL
ncbi:MAG TPA: hemerythrin domain-containing protein [Anaeromyxobacteraceae bacterium]|nr:hemerythrin domain-containing protein [Anaeromyxobacteraceae bacterium]